MKPHVSIIIPVYNSEAYLEKCLDSVCSQTLEDIEIICVDDCSTDGSLSILRQFQDKDKRVRVIRLKQNSGPGAARNIGILEAKGEYLGFVDSDDWVDAVFFEQMLEAAISHDSDMVLNINIVREYSSKTEPFIHLGSPQVPDTGLFISPEISATYTIPSMYTHLYRRDLIINNHCFCPTKYNVGEDKYFHIIASLNAHSIFAFQGAAYHYRKTSSSLTDIISLYNVSTLSFFKDVVLYFGPKIYDPSFKLKLYNQDLFSELSNQEEFQEVKEYLESLSEYFRLSSVYLSDFDHFVIDNILKSQSYENVIKIIGKYPLIRYSTMQRVRNRRNIRFSVFFLIDSYSDNLEKCLQSICSQTIHDIEMICLQRTDDIRAQNMLHLYALEDNRIRIVRLNPTTKDDIVEQIPHCGKPVIVNQNEIIPLNYLECNQRSL